MTAVSTWIVTSETAGGSIPATSAVDLATALAVAAGAAATATTQAGVATTAATAVTGAVAAVSTKAEVATGAATTATRKADIATEAATTATTEADVATAAAGTATTKADVAVAAAATATTKTDVAVAAAATATAKADVAVAAAAAASNVAGSMTASNATPVMDGTASPGSAGAYARGDHVHPTDTSRAKAGANNDITSLSGLSTPLSVAQGGTGTTTGPSSIPPGTILYGPWTTAPAGTLKANGALASRTAYARLFAALGSPSASGDGSTTFMVPDARAAFPRGLDDGRGIDAGRVLGSEQLDALQGHLHGMDSTRTVTFWWQSGGAGNWPSSTGWGNIQNVGAGTSSIQPDGTSGAPRTAAETRPRNIALLACIVY